MTLVSASTALLTVIAWSVTKSSAAFRPSIPSCSVRRWCLTPAGTHTQTSATTPTPRSTTSRLYSTGTSLPLELAKITDAFQSVGDDSLRHKQLLYMANQLPPIAPEKMIPENKVPGCLSTVYIDGSARWSEAKDDYVIDYVGASDGLLTKGLVALLVR
jgi:Fe-S metabolism associated domain